MSLIFIRYLVFYFFYNEIEIFTIMHLADAFIQSNLRFRRSFLFFCQNVCVSWELNPQSLVLQTQCSTTEPQEHTRKYDFILRDVWVMHWSVLQWRGNKRRLSAVLVFVLQDAWDSSGRRVGEEWGGSWERSGTFHLSAAWSSAFTAV